MTDVPHLMPQGALLLHKNGLCHTMVTAGLHFLCVCDGQDTVPSTRAKRRPRFTKNFLSYQSFEEETQTHWPETIIKYISAQTESLLKNLHKQTWQPCLVSWTILCANLPCMAWRGQVLPRHLPLDGLFGISEIAWNFFGILESKSWFGIGKRRIFKS